MSFFQMEDDAEKLQINVGLQASAGKKRVAHDDRNPEVEMTDMTSPPRVLGGLKRPRLTSSATAGEEQAAAAGSGSPPGAAGADVRRTGLRLEDPAGAAEGLHADGVGEGRPSFCFCHDPEEPGRDQGGTRVGSASGTPAVCCSAAR